MDHLLAILNRTETAPSVLAGCRLAAQRMPGSAVVLLHPRPDIDPYYMPTEEIMTAARSREFEAERDRIVAHLSDAVARDGGGTLRQIRGRVREVVAAQAAQAELVVAGSTGHHGHGEAEDAINAVLFDAAAPLLLMPEAVPTSLGARIAVAWERSPAADEAVQAALPLLLSAEHVTLLVAEERHVSAGLPDGMITALRQAGPGAVVRRFGLAGRDIGAAILAEAAAVGADLLVMGAFTHKRVFETLFGGATREVMAGSTLPLLLHH